MEKMNDNHGFSASIQSMLVYNENYPAGEDAGRNAK